ncbi:MAG: amino acid adenylation domain-containing protein [Desulfobacteraceae bacterium]|nr:amino acid adenylation domain-containing protein [Desulfobacteraceae bacterium]
MSKKLFDLSSSKTRIEIKETSLKDIAVIGIGLRLSDYDDILSFEQDLFQKKDKICELPQQRKIDADALLAFSGQDPKAIRYMEMAYLDRIDLFDHRTFKLSPKEAEVMAPDHRLFLETATRAVEDAGYGSGKLVHTQVGVFIGARHDQTYMKTAYKAFPERAEQIFMGNVPSNLAGRISFIMDWQGPALMVDTACSSSLSAVHTACRALRNRDCDVALAGAAKIDILPVHIEDFEIQSSDYRTRAFDNDADGTGGGEGVFAVLLKPLEKALKHNDKVYAVIKGSALNQDGHGAGLTIPNAEAQARLLCSAWTDAGIDPETIRFIEAHGTGTRLGDPIEVKAITNAFEKYTQKKGFCALGTVKSNFGHLDNAAGIAGFVKAVLCLKNKKFPGLVHFKSPNSKIPFKNTPVFPATETIDLDTGKTPARCGVSSFGLSGINCHVVLEAAPADAKGKQLVNSFTKFTPQRHWIDLDKSRRTDLVAENAAVHKNFDAVFLPKRLAQTPGQSIYGFSVAKGAGWVFSEHLVNNEATLPGAAYFQMIFESCALHGLDRFPVLENLFYQQLFTVPLEKIRSGSAAPVIILKETKNGLGAQVHAKIDGQWQTFLSVGIRASQASAEPGKDIDEIKARLIPVQMPEDFDTENMSGVVSASQRWRCHQKIWKDMGECLALLELPDDYQSDLDMFSVHPALLDAAISIALIEPGFVLMSCKRVRFFQALPKKIYSHAQSIKSKSGEMVSSNVMLMDMTGKPLACFEELVSKNISSKFTAFQMIWHKTPLQDHLVPKEKIMVLGGNGLFEGCVHRDFPFDEDQTNSLIKELKISEIRHLVVAPALRHMEESTAHEMLLDWLDNNLYPLFRFIKSFATHSLSSEIKMIVLARHTFDITGDEPCLIPENASLEGFAKVVTQELKNVNCRFLDLDDGCGFQDVANEFQGFEKQDLTRTAAIRNHERFVPGFESLAQKDERLPVKEGGVYVITGGMGGMGLELASVLAKLKEVTLVLLGRTALPPKETWPDYLDKTGQKDKSATIIRKLAKLSQTGARIVNIFCDVSDMGAMETTFDNIRKEYGQVNGVIHCAGNAGDGFIFRKDEATFKDVLLPKIHGTFILDQLTRRDNLDFFVLCSSLTALFGAPGQSDYTAANAYLDAYSFYRKKKGLPSLSINWAGWKETGMAFEHDVLDGQPALSNQEGCAVFEMLLSYSGAQAIVTAGQRLDQITQMAGTETQTHESKTATAADIGPKIDLGQVVAGFWCEVLGYDRIRNEDDFFDLGGDSISAMEINNLLSEKYNIDIPIDLVFENSTLSAFTDNIQSIIASTPDKQELSRTGERDFYPVTAAQKRLFLLHDIVGDSTGYNLPVVFYLEKKPDVKKLENAIIKLIDRHEPLRTVYRIENQEVVQAVVKDWQFHLDVEYVDKHELDSRINRFSKAFNLAEAPLLRAQLLQTTEDEMLLLMDVHHIAADAMSMEILFKELQRLYGGKSLPELPVTYKDYSVWQNEQFDRGKLARARSYYLGKFKGNLPVLSMKTDFPRPGTMTFEGDVVGFTVDKDLFARVKALASQENTTPFVILLTALFLVLHKHSGQEDIIVSVADNGRDKAELSRLVGMFINYLALRTFPEDGKKVTTYIQEVKEVVLEGFAHKFYPFDALVQELDLPRDLSRNPLTGITFSYMNFGASLGEGSYLEMVPYKGKIKDSSKFDMALFGTEHDDRVSFALEYYSAIYSQDSMQRFGQRYLALLETITGAAEKPISRISALPAGEKALILNTFSKVTTTYPKEKSLMALFYDQTCKTPDNLAVITQETALTYRDLAGKAGCMAHMLEKEFHAKPGDHIAILMNESDLMVPVILGILSAGCVYVPLDLTFPQNRISYILEDANCRLVVTDTAGKNELESQFPQVAFVDAHSLNGSRMTALDDTFGIGQKGEDTAYIMYTSGTTGRPKGSLIRHQSVARLVLNTNYIKISARDRFLKTGTIAFDASTFEIWGALLNGAGYCIPGEKVILDIQSLKKRIREWKISVSWFTSSLFNTLVDLDHETESNLFKGLRYVLTGGEKLSGRHVSLFKHIYPDIELINGYGPTENTTFTACHKIKTVQGGISIGFPIANTSVYILDERLDPVPIGVPGLIYTGGDGVSKGYLNLPDLTRQTFIPNPFDKNDTLYNTGDLGCWHADGSIEYLGRKDSQVKIRGFRIELSEIENALLEHDGISRAAVLAKVFDKDSELQIAAYYTTRVPLDTRAVIGHLKHFLPRYMIPSYLICLDEIPLTVNGKTDHRKLPEPKDVATSKTDQTSQTTTLAVDAKILEKTAKIWSQLLDVDQIQNRDDFFYLGGHSLKATQAVSRINECFQLDFNVKVLFEHACFEEFCFQIEKALQKQDAIFPVKALEKMDAYPLSFAQERLWFLDRLITENPFYNITFGLKLTGNLNISALGKSIDEIVRRHEPLRTYFLKEGKDPVQKIAPPESISLQLENYADLEADEKQQAVLQTLTTESQKIFSLDQAPLIRVKLLRLGTKEHLLFFNIHHIVADGWSIGILSKELGALYKAYAKQEECPLLDIDIHYRDFAQWQMGFLTSPAFERQKQYWLNQLSGYEKLNFPTDRPRPEIPRFTGENIMAYLDPELKDKIYRTGEKNRCSPFMILMAAFAILLSRYSGQDDVVAGTAIANRNRKEIEPLIGFFVNTLVLRFDFANGLKVNDFFAQVRQVTLDSYANQDFPFEKLVEALVPERQISGYPITQVNLTFQNMPMAPLELPDLTLEAVDVPDTSVRFDLEIEFWERGDGILGCFRYSTELFNRTTIERMIDHFQMLLKNMLDNPEANVCELPMLTLKEETAIHTLSRSSGPGITEQRLIPDLFAEQTEKYPDSLSVICEDKSMTYLELDLCSNTVANNLISKDIGPGTMIGMCMNRSCATMVAILGIFKSGGVYIPIDPEYPKERISYIVEDAGIEIMVTEKALFNKTLFENHDLKFIFPQDLIQSDQSGSNPVHSPAGSHDPAYVIYTSGSTGNPKGTAVSCQGFARHCLNAGQAYEITQKDRVLAFPSLSFDASLEIIFIALLNGACVVMRGDDLWTPDQAMEQFKKHGISVADLPPLYLVQLLMAWRDSGDLDLPDLRMLMSGGDVMDTQIVDIWRQSLSEKFRLLNIYGPTEAIITALTYEVEVSSGGSSRINGIPLGRPLNGRRAYVFDKHNQMVPIGIPGELVLGGDGIAQEYLNLPELTFEKFIQSPFPDQTSGMMYKTGDLVQWREDGNLEFLGRIDNQVKIRGFRIELEEIEHCLTNHPAVQQAAVEVKQDASGQKQLVGYLVPDMTANTGENKDHKKVILDWHKTVHDHYTQMSVEDFRFNISGWNSSYTGKPIPENEMKLWVDHTVAQIMDLEPGHVLEIGCGTGLILSRVAPACQTYIGMDFSKTTLQFTRAMIDKFSDLSHVSLLEQEAADFNGLAPESFDTVIINSVIQYFPDKDYLLQVVEKALSVLKPFGTLFIGDVRNLKLQTEFYASVELFKQGASSTVNQIIEGINKARTNEEELFVDPEFFYSLTNLLPDAGHVAARPKPGNYLNEMSQYRYDVVIHKAAVLPNPDIVEDQVETTDQLETLILKNPGVIIRVNLLANKRNARDQLVRQRLEAAQPDDLAAILDSDVDNEEQPGLALDDIDAICRSLNMVPEFFIAGKYHFDLLARPENAELLAKKGGQKYLTDRKASGLFVLTNQPALGIFMKKLVPDIRQYLENSLPSHMVPQFLFALPAIPVLPSGKIDRNALPEPFSMEINTGVEYVEPVTLLEKDLTRIWQEVLGVSKIGILDDFFLLGGQSLLAVSLVSRINNELGKKLPLSVLFQKTTIHALSQHIETVQDSWNPVAALKKEGKQPPLFCFYPAGGNIYSYSDLATELDDDIPFYALQAVGLEKGQTPIKSVEEMAQYYISWIKKIQPQGPYRLSGWSFGGIVAFEAACQLRAEGEKIDILALFDSSAKNSEEMFNLDLEDNANFMAGLFVEYATLDPKEMQGMSQEEQIQYVLEKGVDQSGLHSQMPYDQAVRLLNVFKNNGRAALEYEPKNYDDEILLFKPVAKSLSAFQYTKTESQGWEEVTCDIKIHKVPGKHETMLNRPHVKTLAGILNNRLLKIG